MQPTEEALDDILRGINIDRAAPYDVVLREPFGVEVTGYPGLVACYLVRSGRCWASVGEDEVGWLSAGDVLLSLGGQSHTIRSASRVPATPLRDDARECNWRTARSLEFGGAGPETKVVLLTLLTDRARTNTLLLSSPGWLHLQGGLDDQGSPLCKSLALLEAELQADQAGLTAVIDRLGEIVLAQVLRSVIANAQWRRGAKSSGWLRGAADPQIGGALQQMHRQPDRCWTVEGLASTVAMSRTSFAVRFADLVGLPPLAYLRRLRIDRACELLRDDAPAVGAVGSRVGYASEAAFSRAFKRETGATPRQWRRGP